jgi:hypothetical protein
MSATSTLALRFATHTFRLHSRPVHFLPYWSPTARARARHLKSSAIPNVNLALILYRHAEAYAVNPFPAVPILADDCAIQENVATVTRWSIKCADVGTRSVQCDVAT